MRLLLTGVVLPATLWVGCGGGGSEETGGGNETQAVQSTAPQATQPPAATQPPQASPTLVPTEAASAAASFTVEDPDGDCLFNTDSSPVACEPAELDMRSFSLERDDEGRLVVTVEVGGGGFAALGDFTLLVGIDTDRNAATGHLGYASFHGLAPEVELAYRISGGQPQAAVILYPQGVPGDSSLVTWQFPDANHIQATIQPALIDAASFWIVTDLAIADRYDHIPDDARVAFPEGELLPR